MPRFLNTWTGEFVWANDPARVLYAILSHTWRDPKNGGEQTYADILKLQAEISDSLASLSLNVLTSNPSDFPDSTSKSGSSCSSSAVDRVPSPFFSHPKLSDKIAIGCKVAREAGYGLLWIDTCCIDKSSSAELAEAINSMYMWYRLSDVCYAYLADVPDGEHPKNSSSSFWRSRWHNRGWTLQELIAPGRVVFLTSTWAFLGTKRGLAATIEDITGIDFDILVGRSLVDSVSIARRMSWAARRDTTRIEDRAYSLLGLFGVHMAPIYGEGKNAFLRLQEEILKTIPDQSIFAWEGGPMDPNAEHPGLLSTSPSFFRFSSYVCVASPACFTSRLGFRIEDVPPLHAVVTPQGVRMKLLCIHLDKLPRIVKYIPQLVQALNCCDDCKQLPRAHLLAFLQCEDHAGRLLALPLCRPPPGSESSLHVAASERRNPHPSLAGFSSRVIRLPRRVWEQSLVDRALSCLELSILHHYSSPSDDSLTASRVMPQGPHVGLGVALASDKFEFSSESARDLDAQGFRLLPLQTTRSFMRSELSFTLSSDNSIRRPGMPPLPEQKMVVNITLARGDRDSTEAVFSVTNFTFNSLPRSSGVVTPPSDVNTATSEPTLDTPPSFILDTEAGVYLPQGKSTSTFSLLEDAPYVLAHAEFAVYAGVGPPTDRAEDEVPRIRWLRISVQSSADADYRLCIAIELSDVHKHKKPPYKPTQAQRSDTGSSNNTTAFKLSLPHMQQPSVQMLSKMVEALRRENGELKMHVDTLSTQMAAVLEGLGVYDSSVATASSQDLQAAALGDHPGNARAVQASSSTAPDIVCQYPVDGAAGNFHSTAIQNAQRSFSSEDSPSLRPEEGLTTPGPQAECR